MQRLLLLDARERTGHHQRTRGRRGPDAALSVRQVVFRSRGARWSTRARSQRRGSTIALYGGVRRSSQAP